MSLRVTPEQLIEKIVKRKAQPFAAKHPGAYKAEVQKIKEEVEADHTSMSPVEFHRKYQFWDH